MIDLVLSLIENTLYSATVIMLGALGAIINEKSGVVNIGVEGVFILSAFFTVYFTLITGNLFVGILLALLVSGLVGFIHGLFSVYLRGDQVIIGIGINMVSAGLTIVLMVTTWGDYSQTPQIPRLQGLQFILNERIFRIPLFSILTILLGIIEWFILEKTRYGLVLKACGDDPRAAEAMGVNVFRVRLLATILGAVVMGLGGVFLSAEWFGNYTRATTAGRGFIALANEAFSNWNPAMAIIGALLFGFFEALSISIPLQLQSMLKKQFTAETYLFKMIPYVATIIVITAIMKKIKMPRSLGKPYIKE